MTWYGWHRTGEDNADAHMKQQIMGRKVVVAITDGKLDFGLWEQIFHGEFDRRRAKLGLDVSIGFMAVSLRFPDGLRARYNWVRTRNTKGRPMTSTDIAHILLDDAGVAWIDDTYTKVIEVMLDRMAHGWNPEEIHFQHPHLSLAQIHAAFAYYYDHQADLDEDIRRRREYVDKLAAEAPETPGRKKLREQGYAL